MKISEILAKHKTTLSFEVFPPKTDDKYATVESAVKQIALMRPDFMSVTYGAGGGSNNRFTAKIASEINALGCTSLAHLSCVGSGKETINERLRDFKASGIENVLALRGDLPRYVSSPDEWAFKHANELMSYISRSGDICIGGACYPEGHPESPSLDRDIEYMKLKSDCGCTFFTTQMFFDNEMFYRFMDKVRSSGIDLPIIAGIMPITNAINIKRSCELSGATLPRRFLDIVDRYADDSESMKEAGIVYACAQIIDLLAHGISNIHVYVMNKPEIAMRIRHDLGHILPEH